MKYSRIEWEKWCIDFCTILENVSRPARSVAALTNSYLRQLSCSRQRPKLLSCLKNPWLVDSAVWVQDWLLSVLSISRIVLPKKQQNQPKENSKLIYNIKNELKNIFEDKSVVTKILKMDENNKYGNAMTKPLMMIPHVFWSLCHPWCQRLTSPMT